MKHINVALFVPDAGCPHRCSFCNQRIISGEESVITELDVERAAETAIDSKHFSPGGEIAFFGGSFTGIERTYMTRLLTAAQKYIEQGFFKGIRVSTRPDYIDKEILIHLKKFGVSAIELGAQSMDDEVLKLNSRGHTAADTERAALLIKSAGIELGLQMMTGLFASSRNTDIRTAEQLAALKPATIRIYPTLVLDNTVLSELFKSGKYIPQPLEDAVELCTRLLELFNSQGIKVIRLGLHSDLSMQKSLIAGPFHPAFAELCKAKLYFNEMKRQLESGSFAPGIITAEVNPRYVSQLLGQKRANALELERLGYQLKIKPNEGMKEYEVKLTSR